MADKPKKPKKDRAHINAQKRNKTLARAQAKRQTPNYGKTENGKKNK